jgi:hypothetical protein
MDRWMDGLMSGWMDIKYYEFREVWLKSNGLKIIKLMYIEWDTKGR